MELISEESYNYTELETIIYVRQICQALSYLHHNNIVHLDLKVENIMVSCPERRQIKLVDFGIAKKLQPGQPCKVLCGTAEFCSPEVLRFDPISYVPTLQLSLFFVKLQNSFCLFCRTLTDMWSVGVVVYLLLVVRQN